MEVPPTIEKVVEDKEEEEGAVDPVSDAAIAKEVETKLEINNDEEEALESEKPNEGEIEEMDSKKAQKAVSVVPVDEPQEVEDAKKEGVILDEALEETKKEKEEKVEVEEASKETTCEKSDDE
ncbi:eukaryotic translation initiation factor 4B3-like [Ananas comosus]|uniref:Eukaryotic translation initiation factor 4B3-like n=2 Tax=Ananas comosus TaxID=4615 RepID=A0A6P5GPT4_ANACO|nr:eukaryotic translation initiation factor 4B3-like [Ananas comosus]